jgi:hypothetical protein
MDNIMNSLHWHLTANHYPPVPSSMVEPCYKAINACIADDVDTLIDLPEGILWKGETKAPARALVEEFHLDFYLQSEEDEYE